MASRWLIQATGPRLREPKFLHVLETDVGDGERVAGDVLEFYADATRALRFASQHAAERFGFNHLTETFTAVEIAAADLVEMPDDEPGFDADFDEVAVRFC